jgi:hypothetical protein
LIGSTLIDSTSASCDPTAFFVMYGEETGLITTTGSLTEAVIPPALLTRTHAASAIVDTPSDWQSNGLEGRLHVSQRYGSYFSTAANGGLVHRVVMENGHGDFD